MKILQGGVPKCGNFWLYQIVQQILKRSGRDYSTFIEKQPIYELAKNWDLNFPEQARIDVLEITDLQYRYRISSIYNMPIDDIEKYVINTNHVWTHSPVCERSPELFDLFDKKIYIIRDPRDRAISASKYYCSPYMLKYFPQPETNPGQFLRKNFEKLMHEWLWHVWDHLRVSKRHNIHVVFFEGLKLDFQNELQRLLQYLEIDLTEKQCFDLEMAVSFENLKKSNPKHLKKGESGYWMDQLSDDLVQKADRIAGPLLHFLGYPLNRTDTMTYNPQFPHSEYEQLKLRISKNSEVY